jgi:hypothetical protein
MTVKEILEAANTYNRGTGVSLKNNDAIRLVNRAVDKVINRFEGACHTATITVDTSDSADGYITAPQDMMRVRALYAAQGRSKVDPSQWDVSDDKIYIYTSGRFTVEYYKQPTAVTVMEDEPDIRTPFHNHLYLYLLAETMNDDNLRSEFFTEIGEVNNRVMRQKSGASRIRARW